MANVQLVQIPGNAVSADQDIGEPVKELLQDLNLLGTPDETAAAGNFGAVFTGPPQSVAVIESGLTAGAKWWAAGGGAAVAATWASVLAWWNTQEVPIRCTVAGGALLVTAALVIGIAYLLSSDVRGRAAATVATIEARAKLAQKMVDASQRAYGLVPASGASGNGHLGIVPLFPGIAVRNHDQPAANEGGWRAVAVERQTDGSHLYLVVKGSDEARLPASRLSFDS